MSILIEKLVEFRDLQARREGIEAYKVLQYPTIEKINKTWPTSLEELGKIKGIGSAKLKKYGSAILGMVGECRSVMPDSVPASKNIDNFNMEISYEVGSRDELGMTQGADKEPEKQTITVSEYLEYLNLILQKTADVKIQGEVTSSKEYPNGIYFSLKDKNDDGVLNCFVPVYTYHGLGIPLEEGMELKVEGVPRMVKRNGRFLFTVENAELAGEGALKKAYDLLKKKLEIEGIFTRKRALPEFIQSIGVITSRSGAVIHDFRNNIDKLGFKIYLKDVRVEGSQAVGQIVSAINFFNHAGVIPAPEPESRAKELDSGSRMLLPGMTQIPTVDVIVLMRGGGSLEDLQAFNNEQVVRAIFASQISTIVAIGHDKDVPLAQLAADLEVSTPTAAAHAVSSTWDRLRDQLPSMTQDLVYQYEESLRTIDNTRKTLENRLFLKWNTLLERFRTQAHIIHASVIRYMAWVDHVNGLLTKIFQQLTAKIQHQLHYTTNAILAAEKVIQQANPERNLALGYSIVRTENGKVIKSKAGIAIGESISTQVGDGYIESNVTKTQ